MLLFLAQDLIQLLFQFQTVRILQLHCDSIEYTPTKKEIKSAEEIIPETKKFQEKNQQTSEYRTRKKRRRKAHHK